MEERPLAIQGDTLDAAQFPVDILDAAFAFEELVVRAGGPGWLGKEQGTLKALSTVAVGMVELGGGVHGQANGATRNAIRQASEGRSALLLERDSRNAAVTSCRLVDIPRIKGRISGQMGGKVVEGHNGLLIQGAKVGDIAFIERLGVVGQHDSAIVSYGADRHPGTIAPKEFFFLLGGAIG